MTEKPNFHELCNDYVNQIEDSYVVWLLAQETEAEHKRNKCKCPACMSEPRRIGNMISDELERLNPGKEERDMAVYQK